MIKFCLEQWDKNKERLEDRLDDDRKLNSCDYEYLVKLVVNYVLNDEEPRYGEDYDSENITVIDDGHYQGTLLFVIPQKTYQPSEYEYLMTYVGYGSCSGCDTLQSIQSWNDEKPTKQQLKDYMTLCKDIVTNMIRPFNSGWRDDDKFRTVEISD